MRDTPSTHLSSAVLSTSAADECPICFATLSKPSASLSCGHVFHANCLRNLLQHNPAARCPCCRASINYDRVKPAQDVAGTEKDGDFKNFAQRSTVYSATPAPSGLGRLLSRLQRLGGGQLQTQPEEHTGAGGGRAELLDFVLPHVPQVSCTGPSNHVFVLDVSGSMGCLDNWDPRSCSYLCLSIAFLACYIDRAVSAGDSYSILAFSSDCSTLVPWRPKGEGFNRLLLAAECADAISPLHRGCTNLFHAWTAAYSQLQERAGSVGGSAGGGGGEGQPAATQQLVLLTDGEATDTCAFHGAYQLACNPPHDFKALLVKIDEEGAPESPHSALRELCTGPNGAPIPYILYQQFKLPGGCVDSTSATARATMSMMTATTEVFSRMASSRGLGAGDGSMS